MRLPLRARLGRTAMAVSLIAALLIPAAAPATAQTSNVLRVGTPQDLDSMNPYQTILVVGFEVFTLNYELLVGYGQQLEPVPGFVESWEASADGLQYTFKIAEGKRWSDGEPATSEDARFSLQILLDAINSEDGFFCAGYIDPYLVNAAVTAVEAPDPQTLVVTLDRPNDKILKTYVPVIPAHIWAEKADTICDDTFAAPIVGSGPYQAQEWETGQFVRFAKNPNYPTPLAADEVVMQFFETEDTMAQALRSGELDYAQNLLSDQFDQLQDVEGIETVAGTANGFTELGFNTYGTGTGNTIEGGGPSTPALLDPAFRDAVGYAIDKELLIERVLGGYGEIGTTQVPPFQTAWHKEPETPRTFDPAEADRRLTEAGYVLDGEGRRLDKEGNPIVLDLVFPDSDTTYATSAEFITTWWGDLGITVNAAQYDSDTLGTLMLPPEYDPEEDYKADYDLFIWGWGGDVDPNSLLEIFTCGQIGNSSDSLYCNPEYDELFTQQNEATTDAERKALLDQMQEIMYNEAPYHILFYDAALHAYRTDRFTNWVNQPDNGTPLFGYGPYGYTQLQLVGAEQPSESAAPSDGGAAPTDGAAPSGGAPSASAGAETPVDGGGAADNTPLLAAILGLVAIAVVALLLLRGRRGRTTEEE